MSQSVIDNSDFCFFCGHKPHGVHHFLYGDFGAVRSKADEDGIFVPICDQCHVMGRYKIHDNPVSEQMSKMIGQLVWMLNQLPKEQQEQLKTEFIKRYGRGYI